MKRNRKSKTPDYTFITADLVKIIARDDELFLQFRKALGLTAKQFERYMDGVDRGRCRTVAVVELVDQNLIGVTTFPDTPEGNHNAEALFKRCHKEHNDPDGTTGVEPPTDEQFSAMLDDGIYDDEAGYQLIITHSMP
jgi:hypothetical protein